MGRLQNGLRRILDSWGQAALLRGRPGAFLFDFARLYSRAQRLDRPHHPQQGFCFCTCAGWVREGRKRPPAECERSSLVRLVEALLLLGGLEGRSALQCMRSRFARRALLFLRSEAEQRDRLGVLHSFGVSDY